MKKSRKILVGIVTGVIVAAIVGTLLGVFIPKLFVKSTINDLVAEQVIPSKGDGNYLKYDSAEKIQSQYYNESLQSIDEFSTKALNDSYGYDEVLSSLVSNVIVEFWKEYNGTHAAYKDRFDEWNDDINTSWDETVDNYKQQYGSDWEFYFQLNVLDPVGGNEDDWKRAKLIEKANSAFDELLFNNYYIGLLNETGDDVITNFSSLSQWMQKYLTSKEVIDGTNGTGTRNKIIFQPSKNEIESNFAAEAIAKFQEFIFMEWVKEELPLITSMVLWKHVDPTTVTNNGYTYFNQTLANEIYNGQYQVNQPATLDDTTSDGSSDSDSSGVSISASYKWQAFPVSSKLSDSPTGTITYNATDKYLDFAKNFNNDAWRTNFLLKGTNAINIDVKYTDDSATLYFIKLAGGDSSVFNTSYTEYAAGSTYKFNELLKFSDKNVPTTPTLNIDPNGGLSGSEIMMNFLSTSSKKTGFIDLPEQVKAIINTNADYNFKGLYNGITASADTINIKGTPFILTRNESGVHIIGIDRYEDIESASTYEGKINEIANTILWRYICTKSGINGEEYLNNGFTTLDVESEIKTYFTNNRNELLYKYIIQNQTTPPTNEKEYIFSNAYTNLDMTKFNYIDDKINPFNLYLSAWFDFKNYSDRLAHKTTVKQKMIDMQTTSYTLTDKVFGNTVIENGIASVQPYTRDITESTQVDRKNNGYVNDNYGTYKSLGLFGELNIANEYNEKELNSLIVNIEKAVTNLYSGLKSQIGYKKLTYVSAKYNQYLLIGSKNPTSNRYYADNIDIINNAISALISNNSDLISNIVNIQRYLVAANEAATTSLNVNNKSSNALSEVLDIDNLALTGTYSTPTTMNNAPTVPSDNNNSKDFINYYLQNAMDIVNNISNATNVLSDYQTGLEYNQLLQLSRQIWVQPLLQNKWSSDVLNYIQQIIGLKYAFDFNAETGVYEFTKFKEYLVSQTENNKKAAFVWVKTDRNQLISNYESQKTTDEVFSYKKYQIASKNDVNGYIYQGAPTINTYKDPSTGLFKSDTTFANYSSYYTMAPVLPTPGSASYVGFQGMVFESTNANDLPSDAKSRLFSNDLYVFKAQTDTEPVSQGELYNIGSRENLINLIKENVYSFTTIRKACQWLEDRFGIRTVGRVDTLNKDQAIKDIVNIINEETEKIPDSLFTRNVGTILATNSSIFSESNKYFGDTTTPGSELSEVVFTQFNYYDVVSLFDTDGDGQLTDEDKGINWSSISANGFLGTSAEAFFISAIQWFNNQSSYIRTATNEASEAQGKFETFDRRLNDLFGEALVSNYKKNS